MLRYEIASMLISIVHNLPGHLSPRLRQALHPWQPAEHLGLEEAFQSLSPMTWISEGPAFHNATSDETHLVKGIIQGCSASVPSSFWGICCICRSTLICRTWTVFQLCSLCSINSILYTQQMLRPGMRHDTNGHESGFCG